MRLKEQIKAEVTVFVRARHEQLRRHPVLGEIYEMLDGTLVEYVRGHGLMYAAAVAFYALLSLIPLVVMFAAASGYVLHWISGDSPDEMDVLVRDVMAQLKRIIPFLSESFENDLRGLFRNRGSLGLFGALALWFTASQVFRALEYSFAHVFADVSPAGDDDERSERRAPHNVLLSKLLFGAFVATLVVVFLALRFVVSLLRTMVERLPPWLADVMDGPLEPDSWGATVIEGAAIIGGFALLLKSFTRQRVRMRFALLGGVAFYVAWEAARMLYELWLSRFANLGTLYGSFATLMIVVLWIFYSSTILLLCGYIVKAVQRRVLYGRRWPPS